MGLIKLFRGNDIDILNARLSGLYHYKSGTNHPKTLTTTAFAFGAGVQMNVTLKGHFKVGTFGLTGTIDTVIARDATIGKVVYKIMQVDTKLPVYDSANFHQVVPELVSANGMRLKASSADDAIMATDHRDVLNLGSGNDTAYLFLGNDKAIGGKGNDWIDGGDGNDTVLGGSGDDILLGGTGADRLGGGNGRDVLDGGADQDVLTGGKQADTFVFTLASDTGVTKDTRDRITDFGSGADKIDLSAIDADTTTDADQEFLFVGTAAFSHTPGELRYTARKKMTVIQGDVDGDGVSDFAIELTGRHALVADDFIL